MDKEEARLLVQAERRLLEQQRLQHGNVSTQTHIPITPLSARLQAQVVDVLLKPRRVAREAEALQNGEHNRSLESSDGDVLPL